jgi:hypothetical protein
MFGKASIVRNELLLALAMLVLAVGWFFLAAGAYHLALAVFQPSETNEMGLLTIWEFAFSFAAISIATLIGAQASFHAKPKVRGIFLWSQIAASVLFLGYMSIAVVSALLQSGDWVFEGLVMHKRAKEHNELVKPFVALLLTRTASTPGLFAHGFAILAQTTLRTGHRLPRRYTPMMLRTHRESNLGE